MDNGAKFGAATSAIALIAVFYLAQHATAAAYVPQPAQQQLIVPGPTPGYSCPAVQAPPTPVQIINSSGFTVYNVSGFQDYVIGAGASGTITYGASYSSQERTYSNSTAVIVIPSAPPQNMSNVSLTTTFYHQVQVPVNYTVTAENSTNGTTSYKACYSAAGIGTTCRYTSYMPQQQYTSVNATSYTHDGVAAAAVPVQAAANSSYATLNVSISSTAPQGTYWVGMGGLPCQGGKMVLFTIGDSAYSGRVGPAVYS